MASLAHFCLFVIFALHNLQSTRSKRVCDVMSCGNIEDIQFPFGLKGSSNSNSSSSSNSNQDRECSYYPNPSFMLSCNNLSQTILTLPHSGDLIVKSIDYEEQIIRVNDPDGCLPKRFLHKNWNLSGSPFKLNPAVYDDFNLTFLSCPSNWTMSSRLPSISCLSDDPSNHIGNSNSSSTSSSVIVSLSRPIESSPLSQGCDVISRALVPIPIVDMPEWPFWPESDLTADIELVWTKPSCWECAVSGQVCGFANDQKSRQVGCFTSPRTKSQGLPRSAKYGLTLGVGVPGLLCLVGLACFICGKAKVNMHRRRPSTEIPTTISLQPIPLAIGLDGAAIDKYPKTLLGESGRLLKPSDNTCSICLSEYQPKETLRTIPECNHYFHADCIDEWPRLNGTCPLYRNTPAASSRVSPSFSSLSPTSSLSSTP